MGRQTLNVGVTFWWQLDKGGLGEKKKNYWFLPGCLCIFLVSSSTLFANSPAPHTASPIATAAASLGDIRMQVVPT